MPEPILIEDFTDFDKSLLYKLGSSYYATKGLKAFSKASGSYIPNEISNSYPHARAFVELCKKIILDKKIDKFKILEFGSGSGIFARHALLAAKDLGIEKNIVFYLSDITSKTFDEIKSIGVLNDFQEHTHYEFLELNLLNIPNTYSKTFDAVLLNYVFDALPTLPLRYSEEGNLEKLQIQIWQNPDDKSLNENNLLEDSNLLSRLLIQELWVKYSPSQGLEQKYFDLLSKDLVDHRSKILYPYAALSATEMLLDLLDDNGFIYVSDMPLDKNDPGIFRMFANAIVNYFSEPLITKLITNQNYCGYVVQDNSFLRMFYFKNQNLFLELLDLMKELYEKTSTVDIYYDIRKALDSISSPHSKDLIEFLCKKFLEFDKHSCVSYFMQAKLFELIGETEKAQIARTRAQKLDFLGNFS